MMSGTGKRGAALGVILSVIWELLLLLGRLIQVIFLPAVGKF